MSIILRHGYCRYTVEGSSRDEIIFKSLISSKLSYYKHTHFIEEEKDSNFMGNLLNNWNSSLSVILFFFFNCRHFVIFQESMWITRGDMISLRIFWGCAPSSVCSSILVDII